MKENSLNISGIRKQYDSAIAGTHPMLRGIQGALYIVDIGIIGIVHEHGHTHQDVVEVSSMGFDLIIRNRITDFDMFDMKRNNKNMSVYRYLLKAVYYGYLSNRMDECVDFLSTQTIPVSSAYGSRTYRSFLLLMREQQNDIECAISLTDEFSRSKDDYTSTLIDVIGLGDRKFMWNAAFFILNDIIGTVARYRYDMTVSKTFNIDKKLIRRAKHLLSDLRENFIDMHGLHGIFVEPLTMVDVLEYMIDDILS